MRGEAAFPLTSRAADEIVFRRDARAVTVGRFLAEVAALAERLPPTGPVINLCVDRYLALVAFAAALSRGQVTLLTADHSTRRVRELAESQGAAYGIADADGDWALPVQRIEPDLPASAGQVSAPMIPAEAIAAIAFTSGSTGEPTAHTKSWRALVLCAGAAAERFGLRQEDGPPESVLGSVRPQHMYGFETTIVLPLHSAAAGHAGPIFYPSDVAEGLAAAPGRRVLVTTPLQLRAQLASGAPMPPLDAVISATAPLSTTLAEEAERGWDTRVLEIYGATEVGSIASRRTLDGDGWMPYRGVELAIEDRAALVSVPGLPAPVPLADEVEWCGEDGRFRLLGRRADVVKLAGKRASLAGLNRILNEIEGVEDGVFVAPEDLDQNPAARLSAYVVAPGRSAEEILAALRERIEAVFLPRPVVMLTSLPRDKVGKISRRALATLRQRPA